MSTDTEITATADGSDPWGHGAFARALAAFQSELPRVGKDNTAKVTTDKGPGYTYRYADLSEISPIVLPLLGKHGLAWSTKPTLTSDGKFILRYALTHISGQFETGDYPLPNPGSSPQVLGSAITYARRYALCAVVGVAPGDDDDDAAAATKQAAQRHQAARERGEKERRDRPEPGKATPSPDDPPSQSAQAALDLLRKTCEENKWSQTRVAARYAETHGGADLRRATMRDIESYRKGLYAVPDGELRDPDPASEAPE